jgi:TolA-binding protein
MRRITLTLMAMALVPAITMAQTSTTTQQQQAQQLSQLEDEIELQEELAQDMRDSITILNGKIDVLKSRLDSLNGIVKDVKDQISALEKLKKEQEKGIKTANKTRQETVDNRDNLIYQMDILPVLQEPYDKLDVEQILAKFDGMETKDVLKRKDMVENYGKYSLEIRNLLEKYKSKFEQTRWATQGTESELYKEFQKAFKKLGYYKTYEKGVKNATTPTIPYLDKVMSEIQMIQRSGFNSQYQYNKVLDMLY